MIDMHYDLLSILYYCYIRNDFRYIKELQENFNDNNVTGVIANLYFMSEEEMQTEMLGKSINVIEMFRISTKLFKEYFPTIKVRYSIEGCDYIESIEDLEILKKLGLSSILLVWNNKNKYGGGTFFDGGLTDAGVKFIKKCIELDICIDLSHMNKETFYDTVKVLEDMKKDGYEPKVIVSHSNISNLYEHPRNIDIKQLEKIKQFKPVIGLVSYAFFLTDKEESINLLKEKYLEHIKLVVKTLGIDCVGISTDDMSYDKIMFNHRIEQIIFPYKELKKDIEKLLLKQFNKEKVKKILKENIENKLFSEE